MRTTPTPRTPLAGPPSPDAAAKTTETPRTKTTESARPAEDHIQAPPPRLEGPASNAPALRSDDHAPVRQQLVDHLAYAAAPQGPKSKIEARLKAALTAAASLSAASATGGAEMASVRGQLARLHPELSGRAAAMAADLDTHLVQLDVARVWAEAGRPDAVLALHPEAEAVKTGLARMFPGLEALGLDRATARAELAADLGDLGTELNQIFQAEGVDPSLREALLDMIAETRASFRAGTLAPERPEADRDMQRTNWIHTRAELLKAARAFQALPPEATSSSRGLALATTLVGTLVSDAYKDASQHSLLWHNRAGAELVLPLLAARHPDAAPTIATARKLALEHQITPALFMCGALGTALKAAGASEAVLAEVADKVGNPLTAPQKDGEITFSDEAQAALSKVGLPGWTTMDPASEHFPLAQVVALADVMQYVSDDGILKIAVDIRDPEHALPFMRDATLSEAVASSTDFSFQAGMKAIQVDTLAAWSAQAAGSAKSELETAVYPEVEARLRVALDVPADAPMPPVPYWNHPVEAPLEEEQRATVRLVKSVFRDVLAAHGGVPLDPFRSQEKSV